MITQYFSPEVFKGNDVAYYLAPRGVEVTVITGTPNYPMGKFYKGYGWFEKFKEVENGVYGVQVPAGVWHTIIVHEPSVIIEIKDGAYAPLAADDIWNTNK